MTSGARIRLVEDDPAIAGTVAFALQRERFALEHVLLAGRACAQVRAPRTRLAPMATHHGMGCARAVSNESA